MLLDGCGASPVGVALPEDGVDGAAQHLRVHLLDLLLLIVLQIPGDSPIKETIIGIYAGLWICIDFVRIRIRIQYFFKLRIRFQFQIQGFADQKFKKIESWKFYIYIYRPQPTLLARGCVSGLLYWVGSLYLPLPSPLG